MSHKTTITKHYTNNNTKQHITDDHLLYCFVLFSSHTIALLVDCFATHRPTSRIFRLRRDESDYWTAARNNISSNTGEPVRRPLSPLSPIPPHHRAPTRASTRARSLTSNTLSFDLLPTCDFLRAPPPRRALTCVSPVLRDKNNKQHNIRSFLSVFLFEPYLWRLSILLARLSSVTPLYAVCRAARFSVKDCTSSISVHMYTFRNKTLASASNYPWRDKPGRRAAYSRSFVTLLPLRKLFL